MKSSYINEFQMKMRSIVPRSTVSFSLPVAISISLYGGSHVGE